MGMLLEFKVKKKEYPSVEELEKGWEAYSEACQLIDIMPRLIVLKLMTYCRETLSIEEKN